MDGTLTVPNIDFKLMYERCGVPLSEDLLVAVAAMPPAQQAAAHAIIEEMEVEGRRTLQLAPGVVEMAAWLQAHGVRTALVTRNSAATVTAFVDHHWTPHGLDPFAPALSRDSDPENLPAKPHPAALQRIAREWEVALPSEEVVMVGDSPSFDVGFGKAAGVATALVDSGRRFLEEDAHGGRLKGGGGADVCVECLALLPRYLWERYEITGSLGTQVPLLKYPKPEPISAAATAAAKGDMNALAAMLGTGGEAARALHTPDEHGNTPLIWAAEYDQASCVAWLLEEARADPNVRGYLGATAVSRAARRGHAATLRALLQRGGDPDAPNEKRQFPLHFAAFKKHPDAVAALLEFGANPLVLDRKGRTPAEDTSDAAIREVLLAARQEKVSSAASGVLDPK